MDAERSRESCQQEASGADLASVHSEGEIEYIALLTEGELAMLGGIDTRRGSEWNWYDSSTWDYTSWNSGEPNNLRDEYCLDIKFQYAGGWNDISCSSIGRHEEYVCKMTGACVCTTPAHKVG